MKRLLSHATLVLLLPLGGALAGDGRAPDDDGSASHWRASPVFAPVKTQGGLSMHRDSYGLLYTWSERFSGDETEVVFQISGKVRLHRSPVFFAYTQRSFWQAYNSDESSPFRETNHNPELFFRMTPTNSDRLERFGFDVGIEHESNGRGGEDSRSWNRLYFSPQYHRERLLLSGKIWYRLPEDECTERACRDDASFDDNPDITDFMGYAEARAGIAVTDDLESPAMLQVMLRGNVSTGKGAFALDLAYPAGSKDLYWFLSYFEGYGESLIDYDRSMRRVGLGVLLKR